VSLGMLLDPQFLVNNWVNVLTVVVVVIIVKMIAVYSVVRMFGYGHRIAVLAGGGLFQIGEFGFILAQMGLTAGVVSAQFNSIILASTVITMLLTPLSISLVSFLYPKFTLRRKNTGTISRVRTSLPSHIGSDIGDRVIIAGYGRVGQNVAQAMEDAGIPYLIVDIDPERISEAGIHKLSRLYGDATNRHVLSQAGLNKAKALVITYPDPIAVLTTVRVALSLKPDIKVLARVHRPREADALKRLGVSELISPEYEASFRFTKRLLNIAGVDKDERKRVLEQMRKDQEIAEPEPD
jgi:monovalent cation:H+ antiporter-2, CPA2 family